MYVGRVLLDCHLVCCQITPGIEFTSLLATSGVMAEEKDQTGASWENLDEYSKQDTKDGAVINEEEDTSVTTTGESTKDQSEKCVPNLLQMLKAAESRWTPQCRDRDRVEASESETGGLVAEALKTDMVSKDTDQDVIYICIYMTYICKRGPQET